MIENRNRGHTMTREEILYQLLKKEEDYYITILDITREENRKLAQQLPLSEINVLIQRKKVVLTCISEIEKAAQPLKAYWHTKKDRSDPLSKKVSETLTELDNILKEILQIDRVSHNMMEQYMDSLRTKS
jgi:hypothetical protein